MKTNNYFATISEINRFFNLLFKLMLFFVDVWLACCLYNNRYSGKLNTVPYFLRTRSSNSKSSKGTLKNFL